MCQVKLAGDGTTPPEWIELIPAGAEINAFDGRKFRNVKPHDVVARFRKHPLQLPVDYEHSSQLKGPKGEESPAAGWITDLEVRDGSVWGKVEWTPRGKASLAGREYRYVSPAFRHDKSGNVLEIVSAGLTNIPALQLAELARAEEGDDSMLSKILKMLGLEDGATEEQAVAACQKLIDGQGELATARAENTALKAKVEAAKTPDLNLFVPRSDYQTALARAESAEKQIAQEQAKAHQVAVDAEIEAALKSGKITPASKDFYVSTCSTAEGLEKFRDFVKTAVAVAAGGGVPETPPAGGAVVATEAELAIARNCGITKEQFIAARKAELEARAQAAAQ